MLKVKKIKYPEENTKKTPSLEIKRGYVYHADLDPVMGSEQGGVRPVVVIQNDIGNKYSPTVIVAAITSSIEKARLPTHIKLPAWISGLERKSVVLLEQLRTIDKHRLKSKIAELDEETMMKIDRALKISLGLLKKEWGVYNE